LDEDAEKSSLYTNESEDEELIEVHGMWYFFLPTSDNEDEQEALPVSTRSKGPADYVQSTQKKKPSTLVAKDKVVNKSLLPHLLNQRHPHLILHPHPKPW